MLRKCTRESLEGKGVIKSCHQLILKCLEIYVFAYFIYLNYIKIKITKKVTFSQLLTQSLLPATKAHTHSQPALLKAALLQSFSKFVNCFKLLFPFVLSGSINIFRASPWDIVCLMTSSTLRLLTPSIRFVDSFPILGICSV